MRILVTGSSGMIGTALCEKLIARGDSVVGVDRRPNVWNGAIDALTERRDLCDPHALDTLPSLGIDAVVHLAAQARVYELIEEPLKACENILSTMTLLEWVRKQKVPAFLFASSRECYGSLAGKTCAEDLVRLERCESPYAASKIGGEALVHAYARCFSVPAIILRFSNVYGKYDLSDRVIPLFIRRALRGEELVIFGEDKSLDFTEISDAVAGILLALGKVREARSAVYNIASGEGTSLTDLAKRIKECTKSASRIRFAPPRDGEVMHFVADIARAKRDLGFEPRTSLPEGLRGAVEWYRTK